MTFTEDDRDDDEGDESDEEDIGSDDGQCKFKLIKY